MAKPTVPPWQPLASVLMPCLSALMEIGWVCSPSQAQISSGVLSLLFLWDLLTLPFHAHFHFSFLFPSPFPVSPLLPFISFPGEALLSRLLQNLLAHMTLSLQSVQEL